MRSMRSDALGKSIIEKGMVRHILYGSIRIVKAVIPNLDLVIVQWKKTGLETNEYPNNLEVIK